MGDRAESCGQVKEDEYRETSEICCHDQTCFGTMMRMEAKLTLSLEGIVSKVDMT